MRPAQDAHAPSVQETLTSAATTLRLASLSSSQATISRADDDLPDDNDDDTTAAHLQCLTCIFSATSDAQSPSDLGDTAPDVHPTSKNAPSSVFFDQNCSSPTSKFVDPNSLLASGSSVDPKSELLIQLLNRVDYDLLAHLHAQINGHIFRRRGTYTQRSEYNDDHAPFTPEYEWFVEPPPASTEKERTELQNTKHF